MVVLVSPSKHDKDYESEDEELTLADVAAARVKENATTTSRLVHPPRLSYPTQPILPLPPQPRSGMQKKPTATYSRHIEPPFDPSAGMQSAFTTSVIAQFDCDELDDLLHGISSDGRTTTEAVSTAANPIHVEEPIQIKDDDCDDLNELSETALKMLIYADDLDRADTLETYPQQHPPVQTLRAQAEVVPPSSSIRVGTDPIGRLLEKRSTGRASNSAGLQIWRTKADSAVAKAAVAAIAQAEAKIGTIDDPFAFGDEI